MKYKKFLLLLIITFLSFVVYKIAYQESYNYVAIGDGLAAGKNSYGIIEYGYTDYFANYLKQNKKIRYYSNDFAETGYKIDNLMNDLINNRLLTNGSNLRRTLREADLVTISIGANDLISRINLEKINLYNKKDILKIIDEIGLKYRLLINEVKKYNKGEIIMLGYYNPYIENVLVGEIIGYANNTIRMVALENDTIFVDISKVIKNSKYLPNPNSLNINTQGHYRIFEKLKSDLNY